MAGAKTRGAGRRTSPALRVVADETPLYRFLTYRLSQLSIKLNRQAIDILDRAGGLKLPEWRVIALIAQDGELNARRIEQAAGVDPALVSRTFQALEKRSLIALRRSTVDRREVYARLTRKGQALFERVLPVMRARQRQLLAALSPQERALVHQIIDKLEIAAEARVFPEDAE